MLPIDPIFFHYIGLVLGLAALIFVFYNIRILLTTDWSIFTSRMFLKRNESMTYLTQTTYLLAFALSCLTVSHLLTILRQPYHIAGIMQTTATISLAIAIILAYHMKASITQQRPNK